MIPSVAPPQSPVPASPTLRDRAPAPLAYALFVLVGLGAGVSGVLLLAQTRDYGVSPAAFGLTFFTGSAGFMLAGASAGALVHRFATRITLLIGGGVYVVSNVAVATRPPFAVFVVLQLLTGYAAGNLESVLNTYLAVLPASAARLNRLHAFFGVGALLGPLLATWMLTFTTWPMVPLALAGVCVPLMVAVLAVYPPRAADPTTTHEQAAPEARGKLAKALRHRGILLGTVLLSVYVGLEVGMGNWGYSYLVQARTVTELVAGYAVSGYWLGLTLGRFLVGPAAARLGWTPVGQLYGCVAGVAASAALVWLIPVAGVASVGFVLMGFFLGPIFPTTMALATDLAAPGMVATAIGVMNAGSVVGGAGLPWLAGATGQAIGAWTLLPFTFVLALVLLAVLRMMVRS